MSHTPNELSEIFPEKTDAIHKLKTSSGEFARLFDDYHDLNRQIHRGETDIEPMDDFHIEELRKKRLQILDRISPLLA